MNRVFVNAEEVPLPGWNGQLAAYALKAIAAIGRDNWDLSVLLCGDSTIQSLNSRYRNKDEATDVLSFALGIEQPEDFSDNGDSSDNGAVRWLPGDIVISLETLRENARYFNISEDEELRRLLIHGILHLDGMDHETNNDTEPMIIKQERILKELKGEHILPEGESSGGGNG